MIKLLTAVVLFAGGVFLLFSTGIVDVPSIFNTTEEDEELVVKKIEVDKEEVLKEVEDVIKSILPSDLVVTTVVKPSSSLSNFGVFAWTNTQRVLNGLNPFESNKSLDDVAEAKLNDMFARQYFAHDAPTGEDVGDLAESLGYEYILIGENLALGDFDDDKTLVDAWMDSLGHRANILNARYDEIGIAVGKGDFDGKTTWLAVQSFGLPLSACGEVDEGLLEDINERKKDLESLENELRDLQAEIESTRPKRGAYYADLVNSYNSLVGQYNVLRDELSEWIYEYNLQINEFNTCASAV